MFRTAFSLALIVTALASIPAHAQQRVFVSGLGLDTNPCTVTQPCRTFQHAHDIAAANGEIDVIDPAGYGPVAITKGISIQAHGFGGITQSVNSGTSVAINISVTTGQPVTLNGLLLDGANGGTYGVHITSGSSVTILNTVVRHFGVGIFDQPTTSGVANLFVEDTIASDNGTGIVVGGGVGVNAINATLNRFTANNNNIGVETGQGNTTIANSVISNHSSYGLYAFGVAWLAKTVISGNRIGVQIDGGTVNSYGDNYIRDNGTPVSNGSLTPVTTQ
jgi:hypothetical protein